MNILEALRDLDPLNDEHWTADDAPRIDAVASLVGNFKVTRKDIVDAAPKFDRTHPFESEEATSPDEKEEEAVADAKTLEESLPEIKEEEEEDKLKELVTEIEQEEYVDVSPYDSIEVMRDFVKHLKIITKEDAVNFVDVVRKELTLSHKELENAQVRSKTVKKMLDLAKSHALIVDPSTSDTQAIRDYINSQNKARAKRVARSNSILKGIKIKDLLPKSPLDNAMASRKPARGSQRPVR